MGKSLFSLLLMLLCTACTNRSANDLMSIMEQPICLENNRYVKYTRGQLSDCDFKAFEACLLIYYDSTECSNCKVQELTNFDDLFLISKRNNERFLSVIMFGPAVGKYDKLVSSLDMMRYGYPIYIDKGNVFYRDNPNLKQFHRYNGFLLDRNHKIVLVGNPTHSEPMWTLFKSTLDNMLAHDGEYVPEK